MVCGIIAAAALTALPVLPTERSRLLPLDGTWNFELVASNGVSAAKGTIDVPSSWEMRGYGTPLYDEVVSGEVGVYRRTFAVPEAWARTDRVYLRFDGVMFGAAVSVNGRAVGDFTSSFNAHTLDVTDAVRRDGPNDLVVRTHGHPKGAEFDCNDDWTLHGIHRSVTLFSKPAAHIVDWNIATAVRGRDADVRVTVRTCGGAAADVQLLDPSGLVVGKGTSFTVRDARLWTAETPDLYVLRVSVPGETLSRQVGLREVTWTKSALLLNGRPIRLRGVNHHDISPKNGRAVTAIEQWRDVALMKRANVNFIRTSHYPPSEALLNACDALGVYVLDEVPFGYGDRFLEDASYGPILLERARLTLERDRTRACVLIWSVGNENPVTDITRAAGRFVKETDPTRPWCFSMQPQYFAKWWKELGPTDGGDLLNCHYPQIVAPFEKLKKDWIGTMNRPFLSGEYAHAYGVESGLLEAYDRLMDSCPNYIGGAVWMFQDQGILRKASEADPRWRDALVRPDAEHVYDSHGTQGTDGVVYSDRTPQTDYWELRKVYAPVRIADPKRPLRVTPGRKNVWTLAAENRFDFTDLKDVKATWRLVADRVTVASGAVGVPSLAPHAAGTVTVEADVPALDGRRVCWLEVAFAQPRTGAVAYERSFPLRADFSKFAGGWYDFDFDEETGRIRLASGFRTLVDSPVYFRADRRKTIAKEYAIGRNSWKPQFLPPKSWKVLARGEGFLDVEFAYAPTNPVPEKAGTIRMHTAFTLLPDHLRLTYSVTGDRDRTVTENGLALELPESFGRFDWVGQGPYEAYPEAGMLSEFGIWSLDRDDLYFPGLRPGARMVCATERGAEPAGVAAVLDGAGAFVAFERGERGAYLSQVCLAAGKGGKFTAPLARRTLRAGEPRGGALSLYPLGQTGLRNRSALFGPADPKPFRPFFRSYDD